MAAKRKWRWVSRDTFPGTRGHVQIFWPDQQPTLTKGGFYTGAEWLHVPAQEFIDLFGFCPAPGECLKVEFTARKVEE